MNFLLPNRWPLKIKVSVLCVVLTVLALVGAATLVMPIVYRMQLEDLDEQLRDNAREFQKDIEAKYGSPPVFRKGFSMNPQASLARRYFVVEDASGHELYRTKFTSFKNLDIHVVGDTPQTLTVGENKSRFVKHKAGALNIWVGTRLGVLDKTQDTILQSFYYAIPAAVVLVFLGAMLLSGKALRPVSAMTAAAERISAQSPDERLPIPDSHDEIARLTVVLNESFDRLQRAYSSAARFSADASHQLKTPIAVLRAGLDELRMCDYLHAQDRETVDMLLQQTRRLTTLVEDLLLLAQADAGRLRIEPAPLDLIPMLAVVMDDTDALGEERGLRLSLDAPNELYAKADARRVRIILQNLTENAVKYNHQSGRIRISARREGPSVVVTVANTGAAIPEQYRQRLFERFNRAGMGENIKGHGLGLNIARELARAHGGDLTLTRSDGEWTEFALRLPASEAPTLAIAPREASQAAA